VNHFLLPFIAFDLIVTLAVVIAVLKLRGRLLAVSFSTTPGAVSMDQLRALGDFAREQHPHIGEYMRANWSGMPDQLPSVLTGLLNELESTAKERNLPLDRGMLKAMLASSLRSHRIGKGSERDEAFKQVA
jgi:hypothetical protein